MKVLQLKDCIGKKVLVEPYGTSTLELEIIELSPSGKRVKTIHEGTVGKRDIHWKDVKDFAEKEEEAGLAGFLTIVEVLGDIEK